LNASILGKLHEHGVQFSMLQFITIANSIKRTCQETAANLNVKEIRCQRLHKFVMQHEQTKVFPGFPCPKNRMSVYQMTIFHWQIHHP
jgi:hypothetical protein